MSREKLLGVTVKIKTGDNGNKVAEVCGEISVKDVTADCEKATLYPEENCGQPTSYTVCEEIRLK
ncbi:MAG: hypothetical protein HYV24_00625 [Deltaproteobacteria bacterium]|nr:hypothetical protein [Deltaproteobacteria bacterium]